MLLASQCRRARVLCIGQRLATPAPVTAAVATTAAIVRGRLSRCRPTSTFIRYQHAANLSTVSMNALDIDTITTHPPPLPPLPSPSTTVSESSALSLLRSATLTYFSESGSVEKVWNAYASCMAAIAHEEKPEAARLMSNVIHHNIRRRGPLTNLHAVDKVMSIWNDVISSHNDNDGDSNDKHNVGLQLISILAHYGSIRKIDSIIETLPEHQRQLAVSQITSARLLASVRSGRYADASDIARDDLGIDINTASYPKSNGLRNRSINELTWQALLELASHQQNETLAQFSLDGMVRIRQVSSRNDQKLPRHIWNQYFKAHSLSITRVLESYPLPNVHKTAKQPPIDAQQNTDEPREHPLSHVVSLIKCIRIHKSNMDNIKLAAFNSLLQHRLDQFTNTSRSQCHMDEELARLSEVASCSSIQPNSRTYGILIKRLLAANRYKDVQIMINEMGQNNIKPNSWMINMVIADRVRRGFLNEAFDYVDTMINKQHIRPDTVTVSVLCDALGKYKNIAKDTSTDSNWDNYCELIYSAIQKCNGINGLSTVTLVHLASLELDGVLSEYTSQASDALIGINAHIKNLHDSADLLEAPTISTIEVYNLALRRTAKHHMATPEGVLSFYNNVICGTARLEPDRVTVEIIVHCLCRHGQVREAINFLQSLPERLQQQTTQGTVSHILSSALTHEMYNEALLAYRAILNVSGGHKGLELRSLEQLVKFHAATRQFKHAKALALSTTLPQRAPSNISTQPIASGSTTVFEGLLYACAQAKRARFARRIFNNALQNVPGCESQSTSAPSLISPRAISMLIKAHEGHVKPPSFATDKQRQYSARSLDKLVSLLSHVIIVPQISISPFVWNRILRILLSQTRYFGEGMSLLLAMLNKMENLHPDATVHIGQLQQRYFDASSGTSKFGSLSNIQPATAESFRLVIQACFQSGRYLDVMSVYKIAKLNPPRRDAQFLRVKLSPNMLDAATLDCVLSACSVVDDKETARSVWADIKSLHERDPSQSQSQSQSESESASESNTATIDEEWSRHSAHINRKALEQHVANMSF
ncbi:hypothetical protein GQ42DRAFT_6849 [Ramicandelaber brevisporus]|nr:hypothetical protein GQ42DRAFT_6849 [Ramicandelaber brevisporus]